MRNLLKADLRRLYRNIFFIAGCILAFFITWYYTRNGAEFGIQHTSDANQYMVFVSAGVLLFFSIFPGMFQSVEYSDGVIRNKIAIGYQQMYIYLSEYITLCIAMMTMIVCWLVGGMLGGAVMTFELLKYTIIMMLFCMAYASIMTMICMRITKVIISAGLQIVVFQFGFSSTIMLYAISVALNGTAANIPKIMLNLFPIGQWFSNTSLADVSASLGFAPQLMLSVMVIVLFLSLGTFRINRRDVK